MSTDLPRPPCVHEVQMVHLCSQLDVLEDVSTATNGKACMVRVFSLGRQIGRQLVPVILFSLDC